MNLIFIITIVAIILGSLAGKHFAANKAKALSYEAKEDMLMLMASSASQPKLIDVFNRCVTMARARAVRVEDESITVIYARENRTKGRVRFEMDSAFDDVFEGDVGILVIIDLEEVGKKPFYKFIRDADIPTIDDVIALGTGDSLTDEIFAAARRKGLEPLEGEGRKALGA